MGSQFAPESVGVLDGGDAPTVFVDGVASHTESGGVVRVALYASQPIIEPGAEPTDPCRFVKVVVLKLIYTAATQVVMRRQMVAQLGDSVKPSDLPKVAH